MSIERHGETFTPICDSCGKELPVEWDFYDAVNAKKLAGWKCRKISGEWEDICDECQELEADTKGGENACAK